MIGRTYLQISLCLVFHTSFSLHYTGLFHPGFCKTWYSPCTMTPVSLYKGRKIFREVISTLGPYQLVHYFQKKWLKIMWTYPPNSDIVSLTQILLRQIWKALTSNCGSRHSNGGEVRVESDSEVIQLQVKDLISAETCNHEYSPWSLKGACEGETLSSAAGPLCLQPRTLGSLLLSILPVCPYCCLALRGFSWHFLLINVFLYDLLSDCSPPTL